MGERRTGNAILSALFPNTLNLFHVQKYVQDRHGRTRVVAQLVRKPKLLRIIFPVLGAS